MYYQRTVNFEANDFTIWALKYVGRSVFVQKMNAYLEKGSVSTWSVQCSASTYQQVIELKQQNIYRVYPDPVELIQIVVILPEVEVHLPSLPQGSSSSVGCGVVLIIAHLVLVHQIDFLLEKNLC